MTQWLHKLLDQVPEQIARKTTWLDGSYPIFIYGTGSVAQDIHQILTNHGLPIHGFLDHIERETSFLNGSPIFKPESVKIAGQPEKEPVIILGIHNYQTNISQILNTLKDYGFHQFLSLVELYDSFGASLGTRYWLTTRNFYLPFEPVLEDILELWSDEKSKSLYRSILEFRLTGDTTYLPQPDLTNAYHPQDIPAWKMPIRIIDCGAFNGDTLADFIQNKFSIEAAAAFEPDLANFRILSQFAKSNLEFIQHISVWPCAVFSTTIQLSFEMGKGMASNLVKDGKTIIQSVALDDSLPTFAPNLIKMDIEGAEYDALLGARHLISTYVPGLAISIYHQPDHLWQVPLLINQIAPGKYQFFIRSHAFNDFDLVLYAVPHRRNN